MAAQSSDSDILVPKNWSLIPSDLQGKQFRLLFVTSNSTQALLDTISSYNNIVKKKSSLHADLKSHSTRFRALVSTKKGQSDAVDARDNTSTTGTGVPIYWVNGAKVADDYTDFYDGTWDSNEARLPSGSKATTVTYVWTGSQSNGTGWLRLGPTKRIGPTGLLSTAGSLASTSNTIASMQRPKSFKYPLYGLSPVFTVDAPVLSMKNSTLTVTEGDTASMTVVADEAPKKDLTVKVTVTDAAGSDFVSKNDEGSQQFTLPAGQTSATFTLATVNDSGTKGDEPDGTVTVTLEDGTDYLVGTKSTTSLSVTDNDPTLVTVEGVAVPTEEGKSLEFSVKLSRALVKGETLPVPLTLGGSATFNTDYSVTCENPLPQGVTCAGLSTASPTVTFTGPSARIVDLKVNALGDNIKEENSESVQIGLGTLDSTSGTGLSGGATGMDNLADFDIVEAIVARLIPVADLTAVSEGKKDAAASLTVFVSSGTVSTGGVKIPFTVNSGTAQRHDASAADYGTVPENVFIAAGETEGTALVPIVDDSDDEPSELLRFTIGKLPPGYAFDSGEYDVNEPLNTIIADDDKTEISLTGGGTITEQDTTSTATMTVSLGRPLRMKLLEKDVAETLNVPLELTTTTGAALPGSVNPLFAVTASGTNVTLTDANTTTPTLTFTGHDDYENDVQTATVTFTATSNGDSDLAPEIVTVTIGKLTGVSAIATKDNSATLTVADDDLSAGVTISKGSASVTEGSGAGNTDTYTVKLVSQPTGNVSVRVVSGTPAAAQVHGPGGVAGTSATLTFTPVNWNTAQTVTVTGVDDAVDQSGNRSVTISHSATSEDDNYDNVSIATVTATVVDNDTAGVVISKASASVTEASGAGNTDTYTVKLVSQPTGNVSVRVVSGTPAAAQVHGPGGVAGTSATLTFTPVNWNTAQTVTVTGVDDAVDQSGNRSVTISHSATSEDDNYDNVSIATVTATVVDDDTANLIISSTSLGLSEGGNTSYTVMLATQPTGTVTVDIGKDVDATANMVFSSTLLGMLAHQPHTQAIQDLTLSKTRLTFTSTTWNEPQIVTVAAGEDSNTLAESLLLMHNASGGGYDLTANVAVAVTDNDTPGLVLSPTALEMTEGGSAGFTVKLATEPTDTVTVAITGHSGTDLTLDTTRLTFTPATWNNARTVTVTAGEDSDTANEFETLRATASGGGYDLTANVTVTVTDNYDLTANVTVTVTDNDDDLPPSSTPPSSTPVVAIMGGSAITEGEDASFTLTATPAPAPGTNINVAVTISDSGSFARTGQIGSRVVSINDSGTASFTVSTENDSVDEEDGRITVVVQGGTDHRPHGSNAVASVTVGDDDAPAVMAPNGWHLRFGRTVSQQVLDALQGRFAARPTAGLALTVAGEAITSAPPLEEHEGVLAKALGFETITTEALVQGSSFSFTPSAEGAAPQPAFWGQGTLASFTGQEAAFSLDGDVTTALLGADWSTERWRAGAALSHSWGSGSYEAEKDTDQEISSTLTGLFPYGRYGLTPRLGIWAVAGYGWGQLSLEPDGTDGEYQPGANLTMAAVGLDGLLIDGGAEGLNLTTTTDLLTLSTTSEEVDGVQSSEGSVSRLRLGLVATRPVPLAHGASLLPSLEIGVRQDSGDAETGFGLELGAGLTWEDPQHGISAQVRGRTLLTHADEDFREQGMALSFFWQPHPSHRGPSFSLSHAVGATAAGGMDALLRPTVIEGMDGPGNGQRLEAEAAYGFPAFADRLTLTPALALALSPDSSTYGLLWTLAPYAQQDQGEPWEVVLEGQHHEHVSSASPADHSLNLRFSLLF